MLQRILKKPATELLSNVASGVWQDYLAPASTHPSAEWLKSIVNLSARRYCAISCWRAELGGSKP
jgi:hypothetical protein